MNDKYINEEVIFQNEAIKALNTIEEKVNLKKYTSGYELEKEFYNFTEQVWCNIEDIYIDNLKALGELHYYLIEEVINLHSEEESLRNNKLIDKNLNVKDIIDEIEDGKLASRMYIFNDEDAEYYFIGDIHSDDYILDCILRKSNFFNNIISKGNIRLIFLGDYVDRGKEHLKTMEKIMTLKKLFPGNIYLLQGNHDGGNIENDIVSLCVRKPEEDKPEDYFMLYLDNLTKVNRSFPRNIIGKYISLFKSMAILSFVKGDGKIFCGVHGGIPRPLREEKEIYGYISALRDLTDELKINTKGETIINNIIWSDPLGDREDKYNHTRRFGFTEAEFNSFAEILGIDYLIRGHEANEEGYRTFFNEKLYCIFGSGEVFKEGVNLNPSTAYPWVKPKILKVEKEKGINIIDLSGK